jgi:hypothetical protein
MEIHQNRYGSDRSIEKLSHNKLRVMGESLFVRKSNDNNGNCIMFDFEGGPCLTVGGKIKFGNSDWIITNILPEDTGIDGFLSVLLDVKL